MKYCIKFLWKSANSDFVCRS